MTRPLPSRRNARARAIRVALSACLAAAMASGGAASAADGPEAEPIAAAQPAPTRDRPDFLFGQPRGMVGLSTGRLRASAGGVFDWFRDYLIVGFDANDEAIPIGDRAFDTVLFRFVGGFSVTPRVDFVIDVAPASRTLAAEYRDYSEGGRPIAQSTRAWQIPINTGVRYWVLPRGRAIGRLAWVPSTVGFHVGAGGGARWYRLEQFGDFVDYVDLSIHTDRLRSQGWALSSHVSAGVSIRLTRQLFAVAEVRQVWSRPVASAVFNFGEVDLNGVQMTGGIEFVF